MTYWGAPSPEGSKFYPGSFGDTHVVYSFQLADLEDGDIHEVEATPYGSASPVRALALRARPHARLSTDACPSERYMGILISGAEELGLEAAYISKLRAIRVGRAIHAWTTRIASVSRANTAAVSTSKHEPQPSQLPTTHIPPPCYLRPRG